MGDPLAPVARSSTAAATAAAIPGHLGCGRDLGLGEHPVVATQHDRVGVGAADVDAEAVVRPLAWTSLHGHVVEVVAERARPGQFQSPLGAPDRVAGEGDHA